MASPAVTSETSHALRIFVWNSMLDGEMNDRYYRSKASAYASKERALKIFLALTSSGTAIATWSLWSAPPLSFIWKTLSAISAVLAIALPYLDYTNRVQKAAELREGWWDLRGKYEQLWAEIQTDFKGSIGERVSPLKAREKELVRIEAQFFQRDEALIRKCQKEVIEARGLGRCNT